MARAAAMPATAEGRCEFAAPADVPIILFLATLWAVLELRPALCLTGVWNSLGSYVPSHLSTSRCTSDELVPSSSVCAPGRSVSPPGPKRQSATWERCAGLDWNGALVSVSAGALVSVSARALV